MRKTIQISVDMNDMGYRKPIHFVQTIHCDVIVSVNARTILHRCAATFVLHMTEGMLCFT